MENIPEEDDEKPFRHFINKQVGDDGDDGDDDDDDDDGDDGQDGGRGRHRPQPSHHLHLSASNERP